MHKPEKQTEPSMEEILASIRKIIAEEPPARAGAPDPQPAPAGSAAPPLADLSELLADPPPETPGPAPPRQDPVPVQDAPATSAPAADWRLSSDVSLAPTPSAARAAPQAPAPPAAQAKPSTLEPPAPEPPTPEPTEPAAATEVVPADAAGSEPGPASVSATSSLADSIADLAAVSPPAETPPAAPAENFENNLVARLRGFEPSPSSRFGSLDSSPRQPVTDTPAPANGAGEATAAGADQATESAPTQAADSAPAATGPAAQPIAANTADVASSQGLKPIEELGLSPPAGTVSAAPRKGVGEARPEPASGDSTASEADVGGQPEVFEAARGGRPSRVDDVPAPLPHMRADDDDAAVAAAVVQASPLAVDAGSARQTTSSGDPTDDQAQAAEGRAGMPVTAIIPEMSVQQVQPVAAPREHRPGEDEPGEDEPSLAVVSAAAQSATAAAATVTEHQSNTTPDPNSGAIESALTELLRPIVTKWLEENVPALIAARERAQADRQRDNG